MSRDITDLREIAARLNGQTIEAVVWYQTPAGPAIRSIRLVNGTVIYFWTRIPQEFHFNDGKRA